MKSLIKITAAMAVAIIFTTNINASTSSFNEETYIDDIPFSTSEVYNEIITEQQLADFNFEEELYIDDIPFNTQCISDNCLYQKAIAVEFNFEDEQYIDDIEL